MRYFIVFFVGTSSQGSSATGNTTAAVDRGFLNRLEIKQAIQKEFHELGIHSIVITNIIEVSESDYKDWTAN